MRYPARMRSILLGGWVGVTVSFGLAVAGPVYAQAVSSCDTPIRVLLKSSARPFTLEANGRSHRFEQSGSDRVRVDGSAVKSWRGPRGKYRIDDLTVGGRVEVISISGKAAVVAHVPLDEYVEGALVGEIPAAWAPEALRAQAIVSRTYVLHQRAQNAGQPYDVGSTTAHQVYKGSGAPRSIREAVRDTHCRVLTHRGEPILAVFHSAAGGRTASAGEVWGGISAISSVERLWERMILRTPTGGWRFRSPHWKTFCRPTAIAWAAFKGFV